MNFAVSFTVLGEPAPAGSKRAFRNPKNGKLIVTDASKRSKPWQAEVKAAAIEAIDSEGLEGLLTGPLAVEMTFYTRRPQSHFGTGKNATVIKASAPHWPAKRPDVLKLARAVEDAMSGVVYGDDAQIVFEHLEKWYGSPSRCEVEVMPAVVWNRAVAA